MHGVPVEHVAVDLDCDALGIPADRKRCDYLFFGKGQNVAWVSPIELKGGAFRGGSAAGQLQGGADIADAWMPDGLLYRFALRSFGSSSISSPLSVRNRPFAQLLVPSASFSMCS